ncbi:hypothetical protein ACTJKN_10450 [Pedobacter sp. 22163]|uniref:hypothetical protein n=1 Tax=Pedobacter sp. 22163 TaxID=3453883 RepID=UPI003F85879B
MLQPLKVFLVMGSGNDENNPMEGGLTGGAETEICEKAAANGYAAAILKYPALSIGTIAPKWLAKISINVLWP